MELRQVFRSTVLGALCLFLASCWISEKPLISAKAASTIGSYAGAWRAAEEDEEQTDFTIAALDGGNFRMSDAKQSMVVRFLALRDGWFLIQYEVRDEEEQDGDVFYLYQPVRFDGSQMRMYSPDCDETPGNYKGMKRSDEACEFSKLSALKSAALAYVAAVEKGQIEGDPQVWNKIAKDNAISQVGDSAE